MLMKTKIIMILLVLGLPGCSDFLEESSQDELRPATVNDMEQLLNGECYTMFTFGTMSLFTDDEQCFGASEYEDWYSSDPIDLAARRWKFSWDKAMFDPNGGGDEVDYWSVPYEKIKGCNVIIGYTDRVYGEEAKKANLKGEAYTLRAYYYLFLVNMFGQPYNVGDPRQNLGVPLKLEMDVTDDLFTRNTVAEVYEQIVKDLQEGDRLLTENDMPKSIERMNHLAAKALLSRVYLYMEDWDKALEYADKVIQVKPDLLSLSSFQNTEVLERGEGVYSIFTPTEIIWGYSDVGSVDPERFGRSIFGASDELQALFERDETGKALDLRYHLYFMYCYDDYGDVGPNDWVCKDRDNSRCGIRVAEMYLNRAEAYIHKFMETRQDEFRVKALADLNYLRKCRYDTRGKAYQPVDMADAADLLKFYKEERRREMCGEDNHRWFDLRRYGMPELKHIYFVRRGEEQVYVLPEKSPRYVLPIPTGVIKLNSKLVQNP